MSAPFWVEIPRDVVRVTGPDALTFLQGQVSQDVLGLAVGASAWSFVLQPQGKVDAWFRIARTGEDELQLDVDGGFGARLVERLERFKLRTKADFELLDGWRCLAVRGVEAEGLDPGWGVAGADLVGPAPAPPAGVAEGTIEGYEALRIECGVPRMGSELTERTIPAEAGQAVIDRSVSFTKGCYTGQELVARIDSRGGNVPRHLRGLILDGDVPPEPGEPVEIEGAEVGVITSAARSDRLDALVALAYVKRDVDVPTGGEVGGRVARIEALPLLRS
jgi:tRNA-modifying protein YgfZ